MNTIVNYGVWSVRMNKHCSVVVANVQHSTLGKVPTEHTQLYFLHIPASVNLELLSKTAFSHNKHFFSHMNAIRFLKEALENCFVFVCLFCDLQFNY